MARLLLTVVAIAVVVSACAPLPIRPAFQELRPPNQIHKPGTIVRLVPGDPSDLSNIACTAEDAFGADWVGRIPTSATSAETTHEIAKSKISMLTVYKPLLSASAASEAITDIRRELVNTLLFSVSEAAARGGSASVNCMDSLDSRTPGALAMVGSALQADAIITIEYSATSSVSLETKQQIARELSTKLGASVDNSSSSTLTGKGLFWYVKSNGALLDQYLEARRSQAPVTVFHVKNPSIPLRQETNKIKTWNGAEPQVENADGDGSRLHVYGSNGTDYVRVKGGTVYYQSDADRVAAERLRRRLDYGAAMRLDKPVTAKNTLVVVLQ